MRVEQNGVTCFSTGNCFGRVNIDSLGPVYPYVGQWGQTIYAQSCLYIDEKNNINYENNATKYVGIHAFAYMGATPTAGNPKQDIAIASHLLSSNRSTTIGTANLAINWALGSESPTRRDVAMILGTISDADAATAAGDIRKLAAVQGSVKSEYNTLHPEVVYAGYFEGAPSFFGYDVIVDAPLMLGPTRALYFGPRETDGSWRITRSGNNLVFQRRESGSWVTKSTITP